MKLFRTLGRKFTMITAAGATCLSLVGCTDFKEQWKKATEVAAKRGGKYTDLTGPWEGTWKSDVNGHNGKLRALITKQDDGEYEFHYWAQWQRVLSGSFRENYKVIDKKDGSYTFSGEKDLGKMGGKFSHKGEATATELEASYRSEFGDHGLFKLERPKLEVAAPSK
ncbi:MAG: hypothetical protein ACR2RV_26925 [Verrucomicrobiales bacterium]